MPDDRISIELRLRMRVLDVKEEIDRIEVVCRYRTNEAACPSCGRLTRQVHQWHLQRKRDAKVWGKEMWIGLFKRLFRCRGCGKVFMEPDPACGVRRRTTVRLRETVAMWANEATVRAVACLEGVSEGLVGRAWLERYGRRYEGPLPALIGMDGFCVSRPGRMWTGLWDLSRKTPIALAAGHSRAEVKGLLSSLRGVENVQAVVIDLWEPYRQAVYGAFPNASVVADKFHIVALGQNALREVRGGRRGRGKLSALLDRGFERLSEGERERLIEALAGARLRSCSPRSARMWMHSPPPGTPRLGRGFVPAKTRARARRRSGRTRKGNLWLRSPLVEAAHAAGRTKTYLGEQYHRIAARRGKRRAAVAVAHSIVVIIYHLLATGRTYEDLGYRYLDERGRERATRRLVRRLSALGYTVSLEGAA